MEKNCLLLKLQFNNILPFNMTFDKRAKYDDFSRVKIPD